jgi:vacuolar-type H+-ATPase subunit F/Vma7
VQYFFIGERELVLAFSLVGVAGETVSNRTEMLEVFERLTGKGSRDLHAPVLSERPKILILTEEAASMIEDEIRQWQMKGSFPLIVEIPGLHGHIEGKKSLTDAIREAIGIHI